MSGEVRSAPELFPTAVNCLSDNLSFQCAFFSFPFVLSTLAFLFFTTVQLQSYLKLNTLCKRRNDDDEDHF